MQLTKFNNPVIEAAEGQKIANIDRKKAQSEIVVILTEITIDYGIYDEPDTAQLIRLSRFILTYYRKLTLNEIRYAFEYCLINYPEIKPFRTLQKQFINTVLMTYSQDRDRILIENRPKLPEPQPDPEEIEKALALVIVREFQIYKTTAKRYPDHGNTKFRLLEKYGIIDLSIEELAKIQIKARKIFIETIDSLINNSIIGEFRRVLVQIKKGKLNPDKDPEALRRIESLAKELAIYEFYDKLILSNKELKIEIE